ncbi:hypothetical protein WJX72_004197 [[Myrmecia] bisecta]|uniref:Band 7 domain-containing protein n=1 Tax=[Myrmecia] bisecta TaxID=41462 RepID=A0AAW1R6C0_9CHLO
MQNDVPPRRNIQQQRAPALVSYNSTLGVLAFGILSAVVFRYSVHQIPEGHVGVYWRGGKQLSSVTDPGLHFRVPLLDTFAAIQVTMQTDRVTNIPCGTKGGVIIHFEKVEVVNRLNKQFVSDTIREYGIHYDRTWIYDKIHHEINQFCSGHSLQQVYIDMFDQVDERMKEALQKDCTQYAPGIEIISVRVTKPRIPAVIIRNYEAMEEERTKVLVAAERQILVEKEAQIVHKQAIMQAEKEAETSRIVMQQHLAEKEAVKQQQLIENEIYLNKQRSLADADFYRLSREAETNQLKLTPEFLQLAFMQAITNNTKFFFGDKIPAMLLDQGLISGALRNGPQ